MTCTSPFLVKMKEGGIVEVPCGNCISCRIARAREWAGRLVHEMEYHKDSIFVTLTYSTENLPIDQSISKDELQRFFKRLRKELDYDNRKIKYFASGEYGDTFGRPHYHSIIFGISLKQADKDIVTKAWGLGNCHFGTVTFESARYVTSYVMKKYNGEKAKIEYGDKEIPFCLMSKGLGKKFVLENKQYLYENLGFTLNGEKNGLSRYYKNILKIEPQEYHDEIIEKNKEFAKKLEERNVPSELTRVARQERRDFDDTTLKQKIKLFKKGSM